LQTFDSFEHFKAELIEYLITTTTAAARQS